MKRLLLTAILVLLAFGQASFAEENISDLRITYLPVIAKAGTALDFSFKAGNRVGPACTGNISYWIEVEGNEISKASDTVFLEPGAVESGSASILLPSSLGGIYEFIIEMECNNTTVLANKTIEVKKELPALPLASGLQITVNEEGKQVEFVYSIKSNTQEPVPIKINEQILKEGEAIWSNSQNLAASGETQIKRLGPVLPAGNYRLTMEIREAGINIGQDNEAVEITREFKVEATPFELSLLSSIGILLGLSIATTATAVAFGYSRKNKKRHSNLAKRKPARAANRRQSLPAEKSVCVVETEARGMLNEKALESLLDEAGYSEKKMAKAFTVATSIPITQIVKSCIFSGKGKKKNFETTVAMTLVNNTDMDWENMEVVCRTPTFFGEKINEVFSDTKMEASETNSILKFELKRISAKQSASIVYSVPKLISQEEANKVSLPAVTAYKEGKRLPAKKIKIKRNKAKLKAVKKTVSRKRKRRKAKH
jgi:hypothetical protein